MMLHTLDIIYTAAMVVILLGMSIFVHEFGHFLVARWCGMVIEVFSIGLGPALWKKKHNGIVYKIGWIPFGGYVALPQIDPAGMARIQGKAESGKQKTEDGEQKTEDGRQNTEGKQANDEQRITNDGHTYPPAAPWKKIVVSVSGAAGNIILAVVIAWIVYWIGMPVTAAQRSAMVGYVAEDSEAYRQGLAVGDIVKAVNGKPVKSWQEVLIECALCDKVTLKAISQEGKEKTVTIPTEKGVSDQQTLESVYGLSLCVIKSVAEGKSASEAGLQAGDIIVEFNGVRIISGDQLIALVNQHGSQTVPIRIKRNGTTIEKLVTPEYDEQAGRAIIGVEFNPLAILYDEMVHPLPSEQLKEHAGLIFRLLKALVTPAQAGNAARAVGGPVAIFEIYCRLIASSIMLAIWFTGLLNVNLAIINLLPIPVLDGGHVVFSLWEGITRKPASPKFIDALVNAFAVLLIGLVVLLSYRDIKRVTPPESVFGRIFSRIERLLGRSD